MGILGIYASSVLKVTNSYESIASVTVGAGGASTISFSSIPSTFKHLQLRGIARDTRAVTFNNIYLSMNGDAGSNYAYHMLAGDGSTASADAGTSGTILVASSSPGTSASASIFGTSVTDILDYTNTNKNKVTRTLTGLDLNGSGNIRLWSGLWINTAAITSLTLTPASGSNFVQYSSFALYGIKG